MTDIQNIVDQIEGVANDLRGEVLTLDTEIGIDDYIETMIEGPVARAQAAVGIDDSDGARLILEIAVRDLLTDFDAEVLVAESDDYTAGDYAETVLRPLITTTCGLAA